MTTARKASYLLFAALVASIVLLRLGPATLAGLFSFMILDLTHRRLSQGLPALLSKWVSLLIFLVTATFLAWMFWFFIRLAVARAPDILASAIPKVDHLAAGYGFELPFEDLHEFRDVLMQTIKDNAGSIRKASGLLTKGFFQIIVGIFIAILCFFSEPGEGFKPNLFDSVRKEFDERVKVFMLGFEKILGAQVFIAAINTVLTVIFLGTTGMPYLLLLTLATFIFGNIPVVGNIISNTIIVATAITVSPHLAVLALTFLVLIHKGEYFLNSRIVGSRIKLPMWQILLALLLGEALMGLPGVIMAPVIVHYIKEEMQAIPVKPH